MKMPPGGEALANTSDPILSAHAGSHWDASSENCLAVDGLDAIPYETLENSGIPRDVADKLNYRNLNPVDVEIGVDPAHRANKNPAGRRRGC